MIDVSIIIPVFNVEKYLEKCLDSVLQQTLKNIEVILVDDGSTDLSGKICENYLKKDSRVIVIHKENGGLSEARNIGIKQATGNYVLFVDSDDYIAPNMVEFLFVNCKKYNVDIATCGVFNVYENKEVPQYSVVEEFKCTNIEAFGLILEGKKIPGTICNKMIKKAIAEKLTFPVGRLYEDAFYTTKLMQVINTVYVSTIPMYYYVHRKNSITTTPFKSNDMDIIVAFEESKHVVENKFPEISREADFKLTWSYFIVMDRILLLDQYKNVPEYQLIVKYLKGSIVKILCSNYFYKKRKIAAILLFFNVKLYRILLVRKEKNRKIIE